MLHRKLEITAPQSETDDARLSVSAEENPATTRSERWLLIDHCLPALRKTRRQPASGFAARAIGSWCDQCKHGRQTLCRAATRSCSSLHRETCRVACGRV